MSSNINKNNILGEYQPYDIKTYTTDNDNVDNPLIFVEHSDNRKQPLFRKTNLSYNPSTNTLNVVNLNVSGTGGGDTTSIDITDTNTDATFYLTFTSNTGTEQTLRADKTTTALTYNPFTAIFSAENLNGNFLVIDATSNNSDFRLTSISNTPSTYNQMLYTDITYNPQTNILKVGKIDNCFALTSSGGNLPILFIDQTATGKQFLYNNTNFYYNPTLSEFLLQGNTTTQNINCNNLTMTSTDTGSTANPELILYRNSSSPASGDYLGQIQFKGKNSNGGDEIYAKITGKIRDETLGTEDGLIETSIKGNGSFTIVSRQRDDELQLLNGCGLSVDGKIEGLNDCVIEGDVGIGMASSTNPLVELHIQGSSGAITSNGLDGIVQIATGNTQTANKLCFGVVDDDYSYLQAYKNNSGATAFTFGDLILNSGGGNVGIGTISPSLKFQVKDETSFHCKTGIRSNDQTLEIASYYNASLSTQYSYLQSRQEADETNFEILGLNPNGGNVGVGLTIPTEKLEINGTTKIKNQSGQSILRIENTLSGVSFAIYTNHSTTFNNFHIQPSAGGGGVFFGAGSTSWSAISDDRIKHNEIHITNGLDVIMKLQPQVYDRTAEMLDADFNGDLDNLGITYYKEIGFIAQEVYEIEELKHIVGVGDEDREWSIQYQQIIPYNTSAIQQLKKEKDELQNKVLELENEINLIKQHLNLT